MRIFPILEYLTFTRTERISSIILIFIISVCLIFPLLYKAVAPEKEAPKMESIPISLTAFTDNSESQPAFQPRGRSISKNIEEFHFDPNTATISDFIRLGISDRVAQSILNYRNKGGRFYKKEDFAKIYTLRKEDYYRLESWIVIQGREFEKTQEQRNAATDKGENSGFDNQPKQQFSSAYRPISKEKTLVDINTSNEEAWQKLKGIGPAYARRIVNFREKLGGFTSIQQVAETYGLPDSTFQSIEPYLLPSSIFRKIPVHSATLEELKMHPYISNFQATALFNYRKEHGRIESMNDFRKLAAFKEEDWIRLEPYLDFEK